MHCKKGADDASRLYLHRHHWYRSRPGGCPSIDCNSTKQLLLASLWNISLTSDNSKCFRSPQNVLQNRPHLIMLFLPGASNIVSNPQNTLLMRAPKCG
ncbi:hypothetical protein AVEN_71212-1 [Araneus ventricosus]|uniref:Uncharacterized protein n=1 Tax=Araneus ventricosus TaxID=182803 RepID=A0A4Y2IPU7_ARAVE|nr:hypothetical protein AVEN_71212-1 [Araneus ventricosus]